MAKIDVLEGRIRSFRQRYTLGDWLVHEIRLWNLACTVADRVGMYLPHTVSLTFPKEKYFWVWFSCFHSSLGPVSHAVFSPKTKQRHVASSSISMISWAASLKENWNHLSKCGKLEIGCKLQLNKSHFTWRTFSSLCTNMGWKELWSYSSHNITNAQDKIFLAFSFMALKLNISLIFLMYWRILHYGASSESKRNGN